MSDPTTTSPEGQPPRSRPPICSDCHFFRPDFMGGTCNAPQNVESDGSELVSKNTEPSHVWMRCKTMRRHGWFFSRFAKSCGREGRWFQARESR